MIDNNNTILIVDDNPTNLEVLFDYLHNFGFKVLVAEDGETALTRACYARPDIILLDVLMPGIDGFETCRQLKANEITKDIPVIFMTALSDTVNKIKGFELGAVDYIIKPLQQEEVLARITTHLTIRKLQKSLQEQIGERDILIKELDAFAHTVAHDLKEPLSNIIGYLDLLVTDKFRRTPPEQQLEYLHIVGQAAQRMNNIINELLLLASVRKGKIIITPIHTDHIVAEVQSRLAYMAEQYKAKIITPAYWPTVLGYAPWVEEVWANYLSNAIKYGGQPPLVKLGATIQEDGMVRFWIQDNGPGLTPEEQAQLFVPFTRLNQIHVKGYGLGLSIVQRIIEKLGGGVGVESTVGQGSVFFFTLPAQAEQGRN